MKRVASIQDISCLGRCSLTVAMPVISAMGVECAIVPTAVLSTHTMFQGFTCKDLSDQILPIADHWQKEGFRFDAIYTGYLASGEQAAQVREFISRFRTKDNLVFVDPAMADHGKLYPAFDETFPAEMAKVCAVADIVVPNITEACLMTGIPYRTEYDEAYIRSLLQALTALGAKKAVLTGVSLQPEKLGAAAYDPAEGTYFTYFTDRLPASYHGTGDLFSATCVGALMNGCTLDRSVQIAADYTAQCIRVTMENPQSSWYGVEFECAIPYLLRQLGKI